MGCVYGNGSKIPEERHGGHRVRGLPGTADGGGFCCRPAARVCVEAGFDRTPGKQGYVVSYFWQAMVPADKEHCPKGFTIDAGTAFLNSLPAG